MSGEDRPPRPPPGTRDEYLEFIHVGTRWGDNDVYGHVNNVVYYAWFDSAVNRLLIGRGGLDIVRGEIIGLCVESGCRYHAPVTYPEDVEVGIVVGKLGNTSVRYELGVFLPGVRPAVAEGFFVHVFVNRGTRRPSAIPGPIASVLRGLLRVT